MDSCSRARQWSFAIAVSTALAAGCSGGGRTNASETAPVAAAAARTACDEGNGGLTLPAGFCATVFADKLGHARHLVVGPNGDVYVNTRSEARSKMTNAPGGFVVVLRDADRDGRAEIVQRFGPVYLPGQPGGGTGLAIHDDWLLAEEPTRIVRYRLSEEQLVPAGEPEVVLIGLPDDGDHTAHPFTTGPDGALYVNSGSASNSCQEKNRAAASRGRPGCPELLTRAGIWKYEAARPSQVFSEVGRYASGLRNTVALAVDPRTEALFAAVHGRDQLSENWPRLYTAGQNNELPAEIFARIQRGDDFGWPTCYFDAAQKKNVLAPEYGGDGGKAVGACGDKKTPAVAFPAHWAPNGLAFYNATAFPEKYRGGAFVAFHGSWNRTPIQSGFLVAFVPFNNGNPIGTYEEFATGFGGRPLPADPAQAPHRPTGIAVGPDGALYVSDDVGGRIWRIVVR